MTVYCALSDGKIVPIPTNKHGKYRIVSYPVALSHPSTKGSWFVVHKSLTDSGRPDYKWAVTVMGTGLRFSFGNTMKEAIEHGAQRFKMYDDARIGVIIANAKQSFAPRLAARGLVESL